MSLTSYHKENDNWVQSVQTYMYNDGWVQPSNITGMSGTIYVQLPAPSLITDTFVYDGNSKQIYVQNFSSRFEYKNGTEIATNVGSYSCSVHLIDSNYKWFDGTNTPKTVSWSITSATLQVPSQAEPLTFLRGVSQSPRWSNYNSSLMTVSGTTTATNAGTYTVTFTLSSPNYKWSDGTTSPKTVSWSILKRLITIPSTTGSITYNGTLQSVTWTNYNSVFINKSGDSGINAGNYTAVLSLVDPINTTWSDNTTANKSIAWSIAKRSVVIPYILSSIYNGSEQSPVLVDFDPAYSTVGGTTTATEAGTYIVTFTLVDSNNNMWTDSTTSPKNSNWVINKLVLRIPTLNTSPKYTGSQVSPVINNFNPDYCSMSGDAQVNPGNYVAIVSLNNATSCSWSDNTTTDKLIHWQVVPWVLGGEVFYVDSSSSGATYKFYDLNLTELTTHTPSGLSNAQYYIKSGTASKDKFYVVGTGITYVKWALSDSYNYNIRTLNYVGSGKQNTYNCMNSGMTIGDNTVFYWVNRYNEPQGGSPGDWYIGSKAEYDKLRLFLPELFTSEAIWSSCTDPDTDYWGNYVWSYIYFDTEWMSLAKDSNPNSFRLPLTARLIRSF